MIKTDERRERLTALAGISLRPATPSDEDFLLRVYAGTRADEMAAVPWTDEDKDAFVRMQFSAQDTHYRTHRPNADFLVIERKGEPIGRLYLDRRADEIRIVDIALLPEFRGAGIGRALVEQVMDEARAAGKPVRMYVERFNPVLALYTRLGFNAISDEGVHYLMEYSADTTS